MLLLSQERLAGKGVDSATARLDTPATREKWAAVLNAAQLSQEQEDVFVEVCTSQQACLLAMLGGDLSCSWPAVTQHWGTG